jgi:hypothetical protein
MDDEARLPVAEFLQRKGAVGVLAQIDPGEGTPVGELVRSVHISRNTVQKRIGDGEDLDLFERGYKRGVDHGNTRRVKYTDRGQYLREQLEKLRLVEAYQALFEASETVSSRTGVLQEGIWETAIEDKHWPYPGDTSGEYSDTRGREPDIEEIDDEE